MVVARPSSEAALLRHRWSASSIPVWRTRMAHEQEAGVIGRRRRQEVVQRRGAVPHVPEKASKAWSTQHSYLTSVYMHGWAGHACM